MWKFTFEGKIMYTNKLALLNNLTLHCNPRKPEKNHQIFFFLCHSIGSRCVSPGSSLKTPLLFFGTLKFKYHFKAKSKLKYKPINGILSSGLSNDLEIECFCLKKFQFLQISLPYFQNFDDSQQNYKGLIPENWAIPEKN